MPPYASESTPTVVSPVRVGLALLAVYVIWGSTYVAILFAIDTLPPFLMAGVRFTLAGGILYGILRSRGHAPPERRHWLSALIVGGLLLTVGNGGVTWAEQTVPSGTAALILAGIPAWMVLFDWIRPDGRRPSLQEVIGVLLGLLGIGMLMSGGGGSLLVGIDPVGAIVLLLASLGWAYGSIVSRAVPVPTSAMQLTAMQMLAGGALLLIVGTATGEWGRLDVGRVSRGSLLALGYLIVFGSWVGYTAYIWLLRSTTPAVASSYAFVNPAIAVLLGWLLAGELVDSRMLGAMVLIVAGVALIILRPRKRVRPEMVPAESSVPPPAPPAIAAPATVAGRRPWPLRRP